MSNTDDDSGFNGEPCRISFGEWARDIRTVKLIERCENAERDNQELAFAYELAQQKIKDLQGPLDNYVGKSALAAHEKLVGGLRDDLIASRERFGRLRHHR